MTRHFIDRIILESNLIIKENYTIREVAKFINISKSTVHKDINTFLPLIDKIRYNDVKKILSKHFLNKHLKGGEITKKRYEEGKYVIIPN